MKLLWRSDQPTNDYPTNQGGENMARYALNLPAELKREAELLAERQGISLNQFILWSVAEKVGALRQGLEDPDLPNLAYHHGPVEEGVVGVLRPSR
jgi:hypothetical protein